MYTLEDFFKNCYNTSIKFSSTNNNIKIKKRSKQLDLKAIGIDYDKVNDIWNALSKFILIHLDNNKVFFLLYSLFFTKYRL